MEYFVNFSLGLLLVFKLQYCDMSVLFTDWMIHHFLIAEEDLMKICFIGTVKAVV